MTCPRYLLISPLKSQHPVIGSRSSGKGLPLKGGSDKPCMAELHVLRVGQDFPSLLCDQKAPADDTCHFQWWYCWGSWQTQFCISWNFWTHFSGSSFDHQKTDNYITCIYWFKDFLLSNMQFTFQQFSFERSFDYFSYSTLIFFPIDLCHVLLWHNHLLPKFSVLLPISFLSFISGQQLHFLGLYTGAHLMALFQNASVNFVKK